jgi:DNA-binding NarL/FixJ family response regulator
MTAPIRVLIADDHPAARAGVREALEADGGFEVCGEAADARGAVELAASERPDVCLLDVHMPGSGIRAAHEVTSSLQETAVVMLTVSRNDSDLFDSLKAGAAGYLLKDTDPERLPHALRGVLAGEAALPRELVSRVIDEFRGRGRRRTRVAAQRGVELTSREWEVLDLMRERLSTAEIAKRLVLSPVTVRRHVSAILGKLRVPDRESALRLVENAGDARPEGSEPGS